MEINISIIVPLSILKFGMLYLSSDTKFLCDLNNRYLYLLYIIKVDKQQL